MHPYKLRPASLAPLLALLAVFSGCGDSPTGPKPPGPNILYPGRVVSGTINSLRDTSRYDLVLTQGQDAIVYFMVKGELLRLEVRDSTGRLVSAASDARNTTNPERRSTTVIRASASYYHVAVSSVSADGASDYEIRVVAASRAPEHAPVVVPLNTIVAGEDISHAQDVDSFTVTVPQDQEVNVYLRQTRRTSQSIGVLLTGPTCCWIATMYVTGADSVLGAQSSGRLTLAAGVQYTLLVYGYGSDTTSIPYEFEFRTIDRRPETGPAAITPKDTLRGTIDYVGDLDEYTLTGAPGARFNLFAEAQGTAPHGVHAAIGPPAYDQQIARAVAGGSPLAENASGTFALPASGQVTISASDLSDRSIGYVGSYTLLVVPIDSAPEGTAAALPLGRPVTSRIDCLGDLDIFTIAVSTDTAVNLLLSRTPGVPGRPLRLTLLTAADSVITQRLLGVGVAGEADTVALGTHWLHPGTYKLRVEPTSSMNGGFVGDYQVLVRTIQTSPEHGPATIAIGDTIRSERLDVPGDIDRFHLTLSAGDSVYLTLDVLVPEVGARAYLYRALDQAFVGGVEANSSQAGRSRLITVPTSGDYYVEMSGQSSGIPQSEQGPYELALDRISSAPEVGPATVTLGDTVRGWIEVPGDVDQFTLAAPAGSEITGGFRYSNGYGSCCIVIEFINPATGVVIKQSPINTEGTGRVTVPQGGSLRVRIREPFYCDQFGACYGPNIRAPYSFWLIAVNRAPETRPAAFAIGDTVSGESIDPVGDIDEFTLDGTAGDTVNVYFQTPLGIYGFEGLTLTLIDTATQTPLGVLTAAGPTANLEDIALARLVLPTTGRYLVRVLGKNDAMDHGGYRFRVTRPGQ